MAETQTKRAEFAEGRWICPDCGADAVVDRGRILASMPPQHNATCSECAWRGYVWAMSEPVAANG